MCSCKIIIANKSLFTVLLTNALFCSTMSKNSYEYETEPVSRPSFLTWLCILTFIGSGWSIVSSVYTYVSAEKYANLLSEKKPLQKDSAYVDSTGAVHNEKKVFSEKIKAISIPDATAFGNLPLATSYVLSIAVLI